MLKCFDYGQTRTKLLFGCRVTVGTAHSDCTFEPSLPGERFGKSHKRLFCKVTPFSGSINHNGAVSAGGQVERSNRLFASQTELTVD